MIQMPLSDRNRHFMELIEGDCLEELKKIPSDTIDSMVTDPPAGIAFMGKDWDKDKGGRDGWIKWMTSVMKECHRVLKPGAHAFVWALPRTSHWTATALENAGFQIRDIVTHVFGSGFPKSHNISKGIDKAAGVEREILGYRWDGWGTALKPASEHWILIRKPLSEKTIADNVLKHGTGGINVDASRIGSEVRHNMQKDTKSWSGNNWSGAPQKNSGEIKTVKGRFPANFICSGEARKMLDEQSGKLISGGKKGKKYISGSDADTVLSMNKGFGGICLSDQGGASRFFYNGFSVEDDVLNHSCKTLNAINVVLFLRTINQTIEKSVQINADTTQKEKLAQIVKSVGIKCNTCTTHIAQELVKIKNSDFKSEVLPAIRDCIGSLKNSTLIQSLALTVENLESTDTTQIIQNLSQLFGCALFAIDENTNSENHRKELGLEKVTRFLYSAKASKSERNTGCEGLGKKNPTQEYRMNAVEGDPRKPAKCTGNEAVANHHPTVKALKLMKYLITMITPRGGTVLDPFMGSGSTGVACNTLGVDFIGIEKEQEYFEIASKRIG